MPRPQQFIFSTDYPTLKQQNRAVATMTIASSAVVPAGGTLETHGDATVGTIGSLLRSRIASASNGNQQIVGDAVVYSRTGTVGGSAAPYSVLAIVYRISATQLRFQVLIQNPYGQPLVTQAAGESITITAVCFLAPYA